MGKEATLTVAFLPVQHPIGNGNPSGSTKRDNVLGAAAPRRRGIAPNIARWRFEPILSGVPYRQRSHPRGGFCLYSVPDGRCDPHPVECHVTVTLAVVFLYFLPPTHQYPSSRAPVRKKPV